MSGLRADTKPSERPGVGYLALAMSVIELGIAEAMEGDEKAETWLDSRAFDFWCDWADMNPAWLRQNVRRQMALGLRGYGRASKYTPADIGRAVEMFTNGTSIWRISRRFRVSPTTVERWLADRIGYRRQQEAA